MTGADLANKVKAVLTKVKACDHDVYLRVRSSTGGNLAINLPDSSVTTDTLLTPRPALTIISLEDVQNSSGALMLGDMLFTCSSAVSPDIIKTGFILYDSRAYKIFKIVPIIYDGIVVVTEVYVRSNT